MARTETYSTSLPFKVLAAIVALVALTLGGATELWAQAVVFSLMGLILLLIPPRRAFGWFPTLLLFALMLIALAAFLPAAWFPASPWRTHLTQDLGLELPFTRTPQPWLTLQACALLSGGLIWTASLFSLAWRREERLLVTGILVGGVGLLAAVAVVGFIIGWHPPFWHQEQNRGWFPNRNQTGDVLAVAGILNYVLLIDRLSKGRYRGYFWLLSLAAICAALVIATSRAGILMFFGGIILWHIWPTPQAQVGQTLARLRWFRPWMLQGGQSMKWPVLGLTLALALLSLFLIYGGQTLDRFSNSSAPVKGEPTMDYRLCIQEDALRFSTDSPIFGVGLGNFDVLFPQYRQASLAQNRALHPESDWLWATCELGWAAPLIFLGGVFWWLTRCLPFQIKAGETLRRGAVVAMVMCLLHGFIDVSGHRLGSFLVALLVASMAVRKISSQQPWRVRRLIFRGFGVWLLLVAGWWFGSCAMEPFLPPTTVTLARLKANVRSTTKASDLLAADAYAQAALAIAPLDWSLHFQRGYAEAYQRSHLLPAIREFQTARALEPNWARHYYDEGAAWLALGDPDRCLEAWEEALRRAGPEAAAFYGQFLGLAHDNPLVLEGLEKFASGRPDWLLLYLRDASLDDQRKAVTDLLKVDPELKTLSDTQRAQFFKNWWDKGEKADHDDLLQHLADHPAWQAQGWIYLAEAAAEQNDFQGACTLVARYSERPKLPNLTTSMNPSELESVFYVHPQDLSNGMLLYQSDLKQERTDDALSVIRAMEKAPDAPAYLSYLEAELWAKKEQWELAWESWKKFYAF